MTAPTGPVRDRIVDLRRVRAGDLIPNPDNWRTHPPAQRQALAAMLAQVGIADAVLARETPDGLQLIDGHLRQDLDLDAVLPVLILDVDEAEARLILATHDPLAAMAGIDSAQLAALLEGITVPQEDLAAELASYLTDEPREGLTDPDAAPPRPARPTAGVGAAWRLGEHRLICGDSTEPDTIDGAMAGEEADCVFTDPPYNVDYHGRTAEHLTLENDALESELFAKFMLAAYEQMYRAAAPGAVIYVCHSDMAASAFRATLVEAGWLLKQCLVWVKNSFVLSRQDYNWQHESILYGWKPGAAHLWGGAFTESTLIDAAPDLASMKKAELLEMLTSLMEASTVIREDRPTRSTDHPTMKPVALIERLLRNSTRRGDLVLDPFAGSGSTLIAAEMTGRRGVMIELDPTYCDVIVRRWEAFTGEKATLDG